MVPTPIIRVAALPLIGHPIEGIPILLVGRVQLVGPHEVIHRLVEPAPGVKGTALEIIPLGVPAGSGDTVQDLLRIGDAAGVEKASHIAELGEPL